MTEIPWKTLVLPQAFNFTIFVGVLIYFTRKPLRAALEGKAKKFGDVRAQTERAKAEAKNRHAEIEQKLKKFEDSTRAARESAETEARAVQAQMVQDAKKSAERQAGDAEAMAQFEYQRAATALRLEVVAAATEYAGKLLKTRTEKTLQTKLNDEFIKKVKAT